MKTKHGDTDSIDIIGEASRILDTARNITLKRKSSGEILPFRKITAGETNEMSAILKDEV